MYTCIYTDIHTDTHTDTYWHTDIHTDTHTDILTQILTYWHTYWHTYPGYTRPGGRMHVDRPAGHVMFPPVLRTVSLTVPSISPSLTACYYLRQSETTSINSQLTPSFKACSQKNIHISKETNFSTTINLVLEKTTRLIRPSKRCVLPPPPADHRGTYLGPPSGPSARGCPPPPADHRGTYLGPPSGPSVRGCPPPSWPPWYLPWTTVWSISQGLSPPSWPPWYLPWTTVWSISQGLSPSQLTTVVPTLDHRLVHQPGVAPLPADHRGTYLGPPSGPSARGCPPPSWPPWYLPWSTVWSISQGLPPSQLTTVVPTLDHRLVHQPGVVPPQLTTVVPTLDHRLVHQPGGVPPQLTTVVPTLVHRLVHQPGVVPPADHRGTYLGPPSGPSARGCPPPPSWPPWYLPWSTVWSISQGLSPPPSWPPWYLPWSTVWSISQGLSPPPADHRGTYLGPPSGPSARGCPPPPADHRGTYLGPPSGPSARGCPPQLTTVVPTLDHRLVHQPGVVPPSWPPWYLPWSTVWSISQGVSPPPADHRGTYLGPPSCPSARGCPPSSPPCRHHRRWRVVPPGIYRRRSLGPRGLYRLTSGRSRWGSHPEGPRGREEHLSHIRYTDPERASYSTVAHRRHRIMFGRFIRGFWHKVVGIYSFVFQVSILTFPGRWKRRWNTGARFCKKRYLSLNTSLKDIFPGGFGEVAQQVFHP